MSQVTELAKTMSLFSKTMEKSDIVSDDVMVPLLPCSKELTADARELKGELYCLPCHDKMGVPICGACRRPIEGRVVNAMGKQWHVEV